jgi:hypothetical protein
MLRNIKERREEENKIYPATGSIINPLVTGMGMAMIWPIGTEIYVFASRRGRGSNLVFLLDEGAGSSLERLWLGTSPLPLVFDFSFSAKGTSSSSSKLSSTVFAAGITWASAGRGGRPSVSFHFSDYNEKEKESKYRSSDVTEKGKVRRRNGYVRLDKHWPSYREQEVC